MLPPSLTPVAAVNAALKLASGKLVELSVTAAWTWLEHKDASSTAEHNLKNKNRFIKQIFNILVISHLIRNLPFVSFLKGGLFSL